MNILHIDSLSEPSSAYIIDTIESMTEFFSEDNIVDNRSIVFELEPYRQPMLTQLLKQRTFNNLELFIREPVIPELVRLFEDVRKFVSEPKVSKYEMLFKGVKNQKIKENMLSLIDNCERNGYL